MAMPSSQSTALRSLVAVLLCFTGALLLWHRLLMQPSCSPCAPAALRVMVVADLHLAGPRTAWIDRVRRESFMRSVFQTAHRTLNPDALIVLGDISDAGRKSTDAQWSDVVARFWDLVRPFTKNSVPIQVVVGNHDVGDHHDPGFAARLPRFAAAFPGLDETCNSGFTWNGIEFVSLNAMAMARMAMARPSARSHHNVTSQEPILLVHLPLYRADEHACHSVDLPRCAPWHDLEGPCLQVGFASPPALPPELLHRIGQDVISPDSSKHLLDSFRPRLVLSGHTHRWCDRVHPDGTREVTLPSLSWRNRDDPGFAFLSFDANGSFTLQRCLLARESTVIVVYVLWGCAILSWMVIAAFFLVKRCRAKSVKPE